MERSDIMEFKKILPSELDGVFETVGKGWFLLGAGSAADHNMMTCSWGGLGVLWNKDVSFIFVRPTRHTFGYVENELKYSICLFDEEYRDALNFCGTHSGRDCDKAQEAGLTPIDIDGTVAFAEAKTVLICEKVYFDDIKPEQFLEYNLRKHYPKSDYHRMYVGEIKSVYTKEDVA